MSSNGTALTARPTMYNGIQMRSRLEAKYAGWLDRMSIGWQYEPQCFGYDGGQYLPDFRIDVDFLGRSRVVYIEVKPTVNFEVTDTARWAEAIHGSEPDALLVLEIATQSSPWLIPLEHYDTWLRCAWTRQQPGRINLEYAVSTNWREVA